MDYLSKRASSEAYYNTFLLLCEDASFLTLCTTSSTAKFRENRTHLCSHYQLYSMCSFATIPLENRSFDKIKNSNFLQYFFLGTSDFDTPFFNA